MIWFPVQTVLSDLSYLAGRIERRKIEKFPYQGIRQRCLTPLLEVKVPKPARTARFIGPVRLIPQNIGGPSEMQKRPILKIWKCQTGVRIHCQVPQRVEHTVALIVRDAQRRFVQQFDEAGTSPAVGSVSAAADVRRGNKERIGTPNNGCALVIENGPRRIASSSDVTIRCRTANEPALDVFRAIWVRFVNLHHHVARIDGGAPVDSDATPRAQFDHEHAYLRTHSQVLLQRICWPPVDATQHDSQGASILCWLEKTRSAEDQ